MGKLIGALASAVIPAIIKKKNRKLDESDAEDDALVLDRHMYSGSIDDVDGALLPKLIGSLASAIIPAIIKKKNRKLDESDAPDAGDDASMVDGHMYSGSVDDVDGALVPKLIGSLVSAIIPAIIRKKNRKLDEPDAGDDAVMMNGQMYSGSVDDIDGAFSAKDFFT